MQQTLNFQNTNQICDNKQLQNFLATILSKITSSSTLSLSPQAQDLTANSTRPLDLSLAVCTLASNNSPTTPASSPTPIPTISTSPQSTNQRQRKLKSPQKIPSFNPQPISSSTNPLTSNNTFNKAQTKSKKKTGEHKCKECCATFVRSDMLTRHLRTHTGDKPFKCEKCKAEFSRSDHLATHIRTHTGFKPYKCKQCPYAACRRDMITRHERTHRKPSSNSPSTPTSFTTDSDTQLST